MYALFIFILINNLIGMVPYSFATTSHFILTFSLSFTVVLGATVLGFKEHGLKFFSLYNKKKSSIEQLIRKFSTLINFIQVSKKKNTKS